MSQTVSKSRFKAQALALFRQVERTGQPIVIADRGVSVLTLARYRADPALALLRGTVVRFKAPTQPVAVDAWEARQGNQT